MGPQNPILFIQAPILPTIQRPCFFGEGSAWVWGFEVSERGVTGGLGFGVRVNSGTVPVFGPCMCTTAFCRQADTDSCKISQILGAWSPPC